MVSFRRWPRYNNSTAAKAPCIKMQGLGKYFLSVFSTLSSVPHVSTSVPLTASLIAKLHNNGTMSLGPILDVGNFSLKIYFDLEIFKNYTILNQIIL